MVDLQSPQVQHTLQGEARTHMELMKTGPGTCKNSLTFPIRPMSTGVYTFKRSSASNEARYRFYFVQQLNCTLLTEQMVDALRDTSGNINIARVSSILSARPLISHTLSGRNRQLCSGAALSSSQGDAEHLGLSATSRATEFE